MTKKQYATYTFIRSFIYYHKYSPTYAEIGRNFGISAPAARERVLDLASFGMVVIPQRYKTRGITLAEVG